MLRFSQNLLSICLGLLVLCAVRAAQAQTPTNTTLAITGDLAAFGMIQGPDGNFYSTTGTNAQNCKVDTANFCSYIYQITPAGVVTKFHSFQEVPNDSYPVNSDGTMPSSLIVGTDGNLYGTCLAGGANGFGTVFQITMAGVFTTLYSFSGVPPSPASLMQASDGYLYGVFLGGIFKISTSGSFSVFHTFPIFGTIPNVADYPEGYSPSSMMQGSDGNFYVTMNQPPGTNPAREGAIDQITPGSQATVIYTFPTDGSQGGPPLGPLVEGSDGNLYGITKYYSLTAPVDAAFRVSPTGALQILHQFTGGADGGLAYGPLFVGGDGNFYGTTRAGGDTTSANCTSPLKGCGVVYQLQPNGTLTTLHKFEGGIATPTNLAGGDGATPQAPLVQGDMNIFYGTTLGNAFSNGTIFELFVPNVPEPIDISLQPSTAAVGSPVMVNWQVHNAFSQSAQVCGATVVGNPTAVNNWSGQQTGTFANNVYSGSATITPAKAGNYNITLTCGGNETGLAMLTVPSGLTIGPSLPNATVNQSYSAVIPVTGGVTPYTWSISGVPVGLAANTSNGTISGTPTQFGNYSIAVTVTDSSMPANQVSGTVSLQVLSGLQIITTALVKGTVDANYLQKLSSSGGLPPYTWSVISGSLPANLQIINFGTSANIVGAPTTVGKSMITFQVADNENNPATQTITLPLNIVPSIQIGAIEFTQEIQEYQTLEDLQASLASNNEPPVPIVASKPGVMRVYFTSVQNVTNITLTATGTVVGVKPFNVPPSCSPPDERAHNRSCPSLDFYFIPPPGPWSTVLTLEDDQGNQLEQETLNVTSRTALGINLKGVALCTVPNSPQSCQSPSVLLALKDFATKILPTNSLTLNITTGKVSESLAADNNNSNTWELDVVQSVENLYTPADAQTDAANQQRTTYVGVYSHTSLNNDTGWGGLGYNGAIIPDVAIRLGTNATDQVFAHEVGHTLDLPHTGTQVPAGTTPPGCYGPGATSPGEANAWIYTSNYIQSYPNGTEYGFDYPAQKVIDGGSYFDVMAYCVPRWISPFNFKASLVFVNGGPTPAPYFKGAPVQDSAQPRLSAKTSTPTTYTTGQYWIISGSIQAASVTLNPIFTETTVGTTDPGSGTYSIQAQAANGQVLYTRFFTPFIGTTDTTGTDQTTNPLFSQFIPVTSGTAMIVIKDPTGIPLTTVPISGTSPTVTITSPAAGFTGTGQQSISWTAQSLTATSFTSRVYYSIDNGKTWQFIEEIPATSDTLDFNILPGASAALIRIDVSDGVNTGSATSVPFSVPKKQPSTIVITSPATGAIQPAANPVYLSGGVYDADDGVLTGTALVWSDNVQGSLGTGSPLLVNLNPGNHTVTLTGTDSDGNAITATTQFALGGSAPNVTLTTSQSTGCYSAVINATPGSQGANLTAANYSLDGGVTYTAIPLANLPFNLNVPGTGNVNLVAVAIDASGQISSQSTGLNLGSGCVATTLKINAGSGQSSPVGSAFATPLAALVVDVNGNPVAAATVTFTAPTTGASATLSATTAVTNISGIASVTATANGVQGSYSVTANATNATATANFSLTNTDFQIAAATPTLTVARGSSGTDVITLTALGGFNSTVNFTCSGLPSSGVSCTFLPASATPTAGSAITTMTITVSQTATLLWPVKSTVILACCFLGLLAGRRRFLSTLTVLCVTAGILMLAGCGGSSASQQSGQGSSPITSSITVTASSGNLQRTAAITLQIH